MRTRTERRVSARYRWDRLKVNFWFAPALMALGAVLLAWLIYWVDGRIPDEAIQNNRFVLSGTAGELRISLLSIASTTLATAGVVFTLLTLPLSTVAAQYGSRLLRLFLGDRTAQFVLGMFVATFVYCIAATFSIPPSEVEWESPQLTATVGLYLMLGTFATLILLVQHISTMLQAPNIAAAAGAELQAVVRATYDVTSDGEGRGESEAAPDIQSIPKRLADTDSYAVHVNDTGYIQFIDPDILLTLARDKDIIIRLLHKPGHFVSAGAVVALVWPAGRVNAQLNKLLRRAFQIGSGRTPTQDIEYAVNQLTEMAVRAMSPAINDPFTAVTCLDHMGDGLVTFIQRETQGSHYYDQQGKLRLILEPVTFAELLDAAFAMLRHASCDNASVLLHMLKVIELIGQATEASSAHQELLRHVSLIQAECQAGALIEEDRHMIQLSGQALQTKLAGAL
jgi:uncharacterized membrane protein